MPVEAQINRFIGHWRAVSERIGQLAGDRDRNVLVKALYSALLDAYARCVYPTKSNRDRFVSFVRHFGGWADFERISLPHLVMLLSRVPDPTFSPIRAQAAGLMAQWPRGSQPMLARDPTYQEIRNQWPVNPEQIILEGISLQSLQHVQLLYTYRNSLVHELRELGYGVEDEQDLEPYYISVTLFGPGNEGNIDAAEETWELTYPLRFFANLCARSLDALEAHLRRDQLDPYASYRFGTYWLTALN